MVRFNIASHCVVSVIPFDVICDRTGGKSSMPGEITLPAIANTKEKYRQRERERGMSNVIHDLESQNGDDSKADKEERLEYVVTVKLEYARRIAQTYHQNKNAHRHDIDNPTPVTTHAYRRSPASAAPPVATNSLV